MLRSSYGNVVDGNRTWNPIGLTEGEILEFKHESTYIKYTSLVRALALEGKTAVRGSGRAWEATGTLLLRVRAVLAESYERIHRSNLVGMGVLPLQFKPGHNAESLGLTGPERLTLAGIAGELKARQEVTVAVERADGARSSFTATARLDTPVAINYYRNGGILHTVLRKMLKG